MLIIEMYTFLKFIILNNYNYNCCVFLLPQSLIEIRHLNDLSRRNRKIYYQIYRKYFHRGLQSVTNI